MDVLDDRAGVENAEVEENWDIPVPVIPIRVEQFLAAHPSEVDMCFTDAELDTWRSLDGFKLREIRFK
jgi:hypothetical protein